MPAVLIKKRSYKETTNRVVVTYTNRGKDYTHSIVVANDEVDQAISGKIRIRNIQLLGIMDGELASLIAYRLLYESMYRFSQYLFKLSYKDMLLEVGDVGKLSDGDLVVEQPIRITSLKISEDGKSIDVEAIEDAPYLYESTHYFSTPALAEPEPIPVLSQPYCAITESRDIPALSLHFAAGDHDLNGVGIYYSWDDQTYKLCSYAGIDTAGTCRARGLLQSSLPAYPAVIHRPDEFFDVIIGPYDDLDTASEIDFFNDKHLAKIDNEIVGFRTVQSLSGFYRITGLIRGLFNTEAVVHAPNAIFQTIKDDFMFIYTDHDIGKTVYFKILAYYKNTIQQLEDVSPISYKIVGEYRRPAPPSCIRIGVSRDVWETVNRFSEYSTTSFTLIWNLASKNSGYNVGGYSYDGGAYFKWGSTLSRPAALFDFPLWDAYEVDAIEAVKLIFYDRDHGDEMRYITEREVVGLAESSTIDKSADLNSCYYNDIVVLPRTLVHSSRQNKLQVHKI